MRTKLAVPVLASILILGTIGVTPNVYAASTTCDLTNFIIDTTVNGNVIVPPNEICIIRNSTINGNLTVGEGAILSVSGTTVINGNVKADGAFSITISRPTEINGNVDIKRTDFVNFRGGVVNGFVKVTLGDSERTRLSIQRVTVEKNIEVKNNITGTVIIGNNQIGNNLIVLGNLSEFNFIAGNEVGNGMQVLDNTATEEDGIEINNNTIDNNAHCQGNSPDPTDFGDPNTYNGKNKGCP